MKQVLEMREMYGKRKKGEHVVCYDGKVWRIDKTTPRRVLTSIMNTLNLGVRLGDDEDVYDIIQFIKENRPDVLIAIINEDNELVLEPGQISHNISSKTVEKIVKHYKLSGVQLLRLDYSGEEEQTYYTKREIGNIPEIVYHGTSMQYLRGILKIGLAPTDKGNWEDIKFNDRVFLTVEPAYAMFHANRQNDNNKTMPIVLGVKIPDKSLIIPDFDAVKLWSDEESGKKYDYHNMILDDKVGYGDSDIRNNRKIRDIISTTGIFAYMGRIPPSHIELLIYPKENDKKISTENSNYIWGIDKIENMYNTYDEFGEYYDGIEEDMKEQEDYD